MERSVKFNAWIPDLGIMLYDVAVYSGRMIGIDSDVFEKAIKEKNKDWSVSDDGVYFSDEEHFDRLLTVLCGDEWYWIEETDHIKLEFAGITDTEKKELFEGDLCTNEVAKWEVLFNKGCFCGRLLDPNHSEPSDMTHIALRAIKGLKKIGNKYENPELL